MIMAFSEASRKKERFKDRRLTAKSMVERIKQFLSQQTKY
jgi:hypothetical protein